VSSQLAQTHITAQERLRALVEQGITVVWSELPGYDEEHVDQFIERAVPFVLAGQRQAVSLTEAFLARAVGRQPLGVEREAVVAAVRPGVEPEQVYRRPFVTVWSALQAGKQWEVAAQEGLERATSTAATDVQMSMRQTLRDVGEADDLILGYQRVPDGGACHFCQLVAGQRYHTADLMPIHNRCGCGVDVITGEERPDFSGKLDNDQVTVREHGELGPVLVDPAHEFTSTADL
jgi:hypothetical protein